MEIAIILFFLAIFAGVAFLGILIYVLYRILKRGKIEKLPKTDD